jgi:hypothetical protein
MRHSFAWLFPVMMAAAFAAGRVTGPDTASASGSDRVYTGRQGDVFRVPSAATRCQVTVEGAFLGSFAAASGEGDTRWTSSNRASSSGATATQTLPYSPLDGGRSTTWGAGSGVSAMAFGSDPAPFPPRVRVVDSGTVAASAELEQIIRDELRQPVAELVRQVVVELVQEQQKGHALVLGRHLQKPPSRLRRRGVPWWIGI